MVLQLVMDMAGTFPILGYLLIKKIFKKHMTAQKYIWILRLSIILYLCPFQEFKYLILPEKLLERFNFADFWGIAGKKISGFEVVNIPSLFGDYYVTPRGIFLVTVIWFIICTILVIYYYGTYFFIKRQIMTCRQNCKVLKNALKLVSAAGKSAQNSTYRRLEAVFPEKNYKYSTLQLNWISSYYEKNPFRPENLKYRTKSGILVRSKSERIIADLLTKYGFLFRYEQKLVIGDNVYYPDFIIMLDDGRMVIWEHFGLMDNEEYYLKACEKIENYRKAGFATHTNLICTYEDDIRSEEILEGIICRYLK